MSVGPRIPNKDFIDSLDRRVSIITGLEFSIDEPTQVANYGIGGHFNPHTVMVSRTVCYSSIPDSVSELRTLPSTVFGPSNHAERRYRV